MHKHARARSVYFVHWCSLGVIILPMFSKAVCVYVHVLKGLALPCVSHFGKIARTASRRLLSTLVAAPVVLAYAAVTETQIFMK